ncbi:MULTISPECIES: peptidoglycan-binding protein [Blautia]|uniref:peptidoglycan-binding protein n=1 Tax=Blautia TaxID=572511 RepID=UPI00156D5218|nr:MULTISPECIES: peptidoglycan-binding protein [Blautia]MCB5551439.1 peptidoglycan-binding protein [Blautia sp. MSK17_66]NSK02960.1 peptidoglycan-binding protein [Blautia obeum]
MRSYRDIQAQQENVDRGGLKVTVMTADGTRPVENALVKISYTGESGQTIEEVRTDSSGQTPVLDVKTPPLEYSMKPSEQQPYAEYTVQVEAEGFENSEIAGIQVLPSVRAEQPVRIAFQANASFERLVIGPHTLWGEYPPKIEEAEVKPVGESGEIVLSRVVIPEYVVVHDGPVNDTTAQDYYVRYKDYIKNVASSEIYATWPDDTIRANVLAIMSFTLNRVYTEWYRNKGKDFTITSSTAYDHKWIRGRNIFDSISRIVDELFENYLSRPDVRQPILTQYCDGRQVQCRDRGWMTQWGSKSLGDRGYSPIEILRYFYGNDIYINVAEGISGIPLSWPGYDLNIGATGNKVRQIQEQLNVIAEAYPAIPKVGVDGIYGEQTKAAVRKFQNIFGLSETGITDYSTWYKIQEIYVAVSRIAELS